MVETRCDSAVDNFNSVVDNTVQQCSMLVEVLSFGSLPER